MANQDTNNYEVAILHTLNPSKVLYILDAKIKEAEQEKLNKSTEHVSYSKMTVLNI